jgi:hypothetical protein
LLVSPAVDGGGDNEKDNPREQEDTTKTKSNPRAVRASTSSARPVSPI